MEEIITIKKGKKKINIKVKRLSFLGKIIGLMFRTRNTKNLLFNFEKEEISSIHSLFVFFKFLIIWLDKKNNVLELEVVGPFKFIVTPKNKFKKFIEVPFNKDNKEIIKFFVGKEIFK